MGDRDYVAEMRQMIDDRTRGEDGYVAIEVAKEIVAELRDADPDLLSGWLDMQAEQFIRAAIAKRDHSLRAHRAATQHASVFGEAMDEAVKTGNTAVLHGYLTMPFTLAEDVRKPLGALDHDDLVFVRDDYTRRANENKLWASIMDTLAEKVITGTVADHFSEAQLGNVFSLFRAA